MHIPVGRRPAELLGLKVRSDLDERLKTASREEMEEKHKLASYKKGSAVTGVCINSLFSPTNFVGIGINAREGVVAHREQKKVEKAAKERLGVDFRKGPDRISRRRHQAAGAAVKASVSVVLLGQDDFISVFSGLGGLEFSYPMTEVEQGIKGASDAVHGNGVVANLQAVAGHPADQAQQSFGIDHHPTWDDVLQAPSPTATVPAVGVIGMAAEANVVMLAADLAGGATYKHNFIRRDKLDVSCTDSTPSFPAEISGEFDEDDEELYHPCDDEFDYSGDELDDDSEAERSDQLYGGAQEKPGIT